jgi:hypothetical protein
VVDCGVRPRQDRAQCPHECERRAADVCTDSQVLYVVASLSESSPVPPHGAADC